MKKRARKNQGGFIALMVVLIAGAVGLAIAVSVVLSGVSSSRNSFLINQSDEARAVTDACIERALEAIRENPQAAGSANFTLGHGSCSYAISILEGENRIVEASGVVGNVTRKVRVMISALKPRINVTSWQEII